MRSSAYAFTKSALCVLVYGSQSQAKSLWSTSPATAIDIIRTAYPVGNGRLGAMAFGPAGAESLTLNIDSLWSGGPFEVSNYTGGNPEEPVAFNLQDIRSWIFTNGTGNATKLMGDDRFYGSYQVLGNLSIELPSLTNGQNATIKDYRRSLDLATGVHTTKFATEKAEFDTMSFCSFPDQVCVYTINSSTTVPQLKISLNNKLAEPRLRNISCSGQQIEFGGVTQIGPPEGMRYYSVGRIHSDSPTMNECQNDAMIVTPNNGTNSITVILAAGTNYDWNKGNKESAYTFRGNDPQQEVKHQIQEADVQPIQKIIDRHIQDFRSLTSRFELSLPDILGSSKVETSTIITQFRANSSTGDPYLESLLFDYSNYLFISSSRPGSLPPNLQGRWSEGLTAAWSADYHANINLQMNHWTPDQTGLTELQSPLWDYMEKTWVPRGRDTAKLLYDAPGWVVHNEMNIFGYTGMKSGDDKISSQIWANYPAAAAWMMEHVWNHWEYSQDVEWLKSQGYGMLKEVAEFWLSQLQEDSFSKDGTLVVNPCTSPEHGPTTFGCAHFQQLIHQVFDATLSAAYIVSEPDTEFTNNVSNALDRLDKGFSIGTWGQITEWKLPSTFEYEVKGDTHRHLSELNGWFPGYSLSSFLGGYSNGTVQNAVKQKLISRGPGIGPDANAGWAKVWRAACWARLNDTEQAHFEVKYAIEQNFVANGFSMYKGKNTPFQIDANFGIGGAILSMLIVDLPRSHDRQSPRVVVLGPAIPKSWAGGSVKGMRLRGGGIVDFSWDNDGIVNRANVRGAKGLRIVNKRDEVLT